MKRIVFVKDMKDEVAVKAIENELDRLDLDYVIELKSNTVIVDGDNDKLYAAKQAIAQAGYTVL